MIGSLSCYEKLLKYVKSIDAVYQHDTQTQLTISPDLGKCPHGHVYLKNCQFKNVLKPYTNIIQNQKEFVMEKKDKIQSICVDLLAMNTLFPKIMDRLLRNDKKKYLLQNDKYIIRIMV